MQITNRAHYRFLLIIIGLVVLCTAASATENGASVWPVGAESVAIAAGVPHSGQTYVYEYTLFYEANQLDDAKGKMALPDFKVRAFAVAVKLSHNWGVKFLGGELGSYVAVPQIYEQLRVPTGPTTTEKFTKDDITNINLVPFTVFNHKGMVHWLYELEFETIGTGYSAAAPINIGQHNVALTPGAAITLTPHHGEQEMSARVDYVINDADHVTHYHSGNEFFTQFDARQEILHRKASVGLIGYYYQQTTNDSCGANFSNTPLITCLHGAAVGTNADGTQSVGYKGRVLDLGPQVTLPWSKHGALIFKMDHDMLVQNKTRGNSYWFEFGVPFSYLHHPPSER